MPPNGYFFSDSSLKSKPIPGLDGRGTRPSTLRIAGKANHSTRGQAANRRGVRPWPTSDRWDQRRMTRLGPGRERDRHHRRSAVSLPPQAYPHPSHIPISRKKREIWATLYCPCNGSSLKNSTRPQGLKRVCALANPKISPLRSPGFPVKCSGVDEVPASLFSESRMRGCCQPL